MAPPKQAAKYRTQWAAQFFAAAELTRRGYLVALTLGNAPAIDLLVESPSGRPFTVDVKGLASPNWWLVSERADHPHIYILVLVPKEDTPTYFILSREAMVSEMECVRQESLARTGVWTGRGSGILFSTGKKYQDCWDTLPG